jgi:hypothetical protein
MRRERRWTAALALGTLTVLAAAVTGLREDRDPAGHGRTRALAEPVEFQPAGDFVHPATGFPMPATSGPFERVSVVQYDADGEDVSAGYNARLDDPLPQPIVATVYVYPRRPDADLDASFDGLLAVIGREHGGARPELRKNILLAGRYDGRYAFFGYAEPWGGIEQAIPLRSYVVLYPWGRWWVKWRATTPAPISEERMHAIVALTERLLPPEEDGEPRLALARADEQEVVRLQAGTQAPDGGAGRVGRDGDLAFRLAPRGGERHQPVVGAGHDEPGRAVRREREPLARPARERQLVGDRTVDGALRPVLLEDVDPLRPEEHGQRAHASSERDSSSAVRIRTTCCAVNRNMATSST